MDKFIPPPQELHHVLVSTMMQSVADVELPTGKAVDTWCTINHAESDPAVRENIMTNYTLALKEIFPLLADRLSCGLNDEDVDEATRVITLEVERYLLGTAAYSSYLPPEEEAKKFARVSDSDSILIIKPTVFHDPATGPGTGGTILCKFLIARRGEDGAYIGGEFYYIYHK